MRRVLLVTVPFLLGSCTTQIVTSGEMASVAPMLSVERFLQAANDRDVHSMGRIFGTSDGPIIETGGTLGCGFKKFGSWLGIGERCLTLQEVEIQMSLLAEILEHEDYTIVSEETVPGRVNPTTRIGVNMRVDGEDIDDVPFLVVQTGDRRWLVEEVGVTRITGANRF